MKLKISQDFVYVLEVFTDFSSISGCLPNQGIQGSQEMMMDDIIGDIISNGMGQRCTETLSIGGGGELLTISLTTVSQKKVGKQ